MRSLARRPIVLLTVVALVLPALGAVTPSVLAKKVPPSTKVAGINVDAKTVPELQDLMDRHRLSSVQLTQFYLNRIKKLNPMLNAVILVSATALADARAADKARKRGVDLPSAGYPGPPEGQHQHHGDADHSRLVGFGRQHARRRVHRPRPARRRRGDHRQAEPVRMGQLPLVPVVERLEWHRRPDEHGLRPRPQPMRVKLRFRGGRVRQSRDDHGRHRDRRFDRLPRGGERRRRHQANGRPPQPRGDHPDLGRTGHRRADDPQRDRCGCDARRDDRHRPGRPRHRGPGRACLRRLHAVPRRRGT